MTSPTQIRKLAEFDQKAAKSKANMIASTSDCQRRDFCAGIVQGGQLMAAWQHAQSAKLIELLLSVVEVQGEALEYYGERSHWDSQSVEIRVDFGTTARKTLAKVRELVEGYKP